MDTDNLFKLRDKVALVTGGGSGIGYMIAEGLLSADVKTYICGRTEAKLDAAVERLSMFGRCEKIIADIGSAAGIIHVRDVIAASENKLHILVNNAGTTWSAPLEDFPRAAFEKVLTTNVTGPFELIRNLLPLLRTAATREDPARIINISSLSGLTPPPRESYPYSASKAALIMLTQHLARRLGDENITINAVAPGVFLSKMTEFMFDPEHPKHVAMPPILLGRPGQPEDIAGTVIYLASRAGSYLTGVTIPVAGGGYD